MIDFDTEGSLPRAIQYNYALCIDFGHPLKIISILNNYVSKYVVYIPILVQIVVGIYFEVENINLDSNMFDICDDDQFMSNV